MRRLAFIFLLASAYGQVQIPRVRDAYAETGNPRIISLRDDLYVVFCKADYEAWQRDPKSAPALFLYIDGLLMKGPKAARPDPPIHAPSDEKTTRSKKTCAELDPTVSAAQKDADEKAAAAKLAGDKAALPETDTTKKAAAKKDFDEKTATAKEALTKVDTLEAAADYRYAMRFYLDSQFVASPEKDTKDPWIRLLQRPWQDGELPVSVGPADGSPWESDVTVRFERINVYLLLGWVVLFVAAIYYFAKYARDSDIIRDPGDLPAAAGGQRKAYSLARTQMAVWLFLVAGALVFLFMVTRNENTISPGVLVLLGISFGTTALAATAESGSDSDLTLAEKDAADKDAAAKLAANQASAETDPAKKAIAVREVSDKAAAAQAAVAKVVSLKAAKLAQPTKGFLTDLLSEGTGPSVHRYQMVLFTVILAVIFIYKTGSALVMPEFDATLLGLMGISSGTYLGFKLQGK